MFVDPGRRVYVRRINVQGNSRTRDEVVRRELRQPRSGLVFHRQNQSFQGRLERTGFFEDINVETPSVPGTTDQVDLNVNVKERNTGSLQFGIGYSSAEKLTVSASVSQANIFGSGNQLSFRVNNSIVSKAYELSYLNPYYENVFRNVNIALANEFSVMCRYLGVETREVIDAAATKPFGFMPFYPGPGIGGHCIPVDPLYLSWKMRLTGYEARFISLANDIKPLDALSRAEPRRGRPQRFGPRLQARPDPRPRCRVQAGHRR